MNLELAHYALKEYFGYDNFRPYQKEIIQSVYDQKDTVVLMPTGGGKSLCYQIPAVTMRGMTLVVSPLIALMQDQVQALRNNGIDAAFLNSTQDYRTQQQIETDCLNGKIKLLYISPEKIVSQNFLPILKTLPLHLIAIDEAHCISAWGHDFRPEYTQLQFLKRQFPELPIIALTATADKTTRKDIVRQLGLANPAVFIASFDRPNLSLTVLPGQNRFRQIVQFIEKHPRQSGIIYCLSRKGTESIAEKLVEQGFRAACYHAGMATSDRHRVQKEFLNDELQIIVATVAFGMGIDKPNVRWVIHYNLPKNIESYYQEIGRAGRDGLPSDTVLFFTLSDVMTLRDILQESGQRELQLAKLDRMMQYAEAAICRRKILLSYFGEDLTENCGNCDVCKNPPAVFDGTVVAQKALSALARLKEEVGVGMLIDVLRGSNKYDLQQKGYHRIKTYGAGAEYSQAEWQQFILQMLHLGLIEIAYDDHNTLKLTNASREVLFENRRVQLVKLVTASRKEAQPTRPKSKKELYDEELLAALLHERLLLARNANIPPHNVLADTTINDMVAKKPTDLMEMQEVSGMSTYRIQQYGQFFVDAIRKFLVENASAANSLKKGATYIITHDLHQQGLSPEAIAEQRNLNVVTVFSHLAYLYEKGETVDIFQYLDQSELERVLHIIATMNPPFLAKDIFVALQEAIPYHKIRLALAHYHRNNPFTTGQK